MKLTAQFSTDDDADSRAIRWATNGQFSHVDVVLENGLLGARSNGGVQLRPFDYKLFTKRSVVWCEVPNYPAGLAFGMAQIGKPYNYQAIADMLVHKQRTFYLEQPSWICDEFLYAVAEECGVQLLNTANPLGLNPWQVFLSPLWKS